jgi:hypothetical protein
MSETVDRLAMAQAVWIESRRRSDEARETARLAEDDACERFADYVELSQPGFAKFFRRVLKIQQTIEDERK